MRILVTGGCGFIGSNLVRHLIRCTDHEVMNVDVLTYAGNPLSLADVADSPRYSFSRTDIADTAAVADLFEAWRPDAVMHLAAESHVDRSIEGPEAFVRTNVNGTLSLLEAARATWSVGSSAKHRFVHVSTDEVYGSLGAEEAAFTEASRYDPHSPYAASKAASDHLARAWHDTFGLPVTVTNCSNNFGPFQFPEKLIPVVILNAMSGAPIPVYGHGENVRDWLYVEDHVDALMCVLNQGAAGETYNIGGSNEMRNIDLVQRLCSILDELEPKSGGGTYLDQIEFVPDRPGHDLRYAIDSSKIRRDLGWMPGHAGDAALVETVRWYLGNRAWWEQILSGDYRLERRGLIREGGAR